MWNLVIFFPINHSFFPSFSFFRLTEIYFLSFEDTQCISLFAFLVFDGYT